MWYFNALRVAVLVNIDIWLVESRFVLDSQMSSVKDSIGHTCWANSNLTLESHGAWKQDETEFLFAILN